MIRDLAHVVDSENARIAEPRRRNDPCPCGSGRRYKHCHGSKVATTNDPMPNEMQNANDDFFEDAESVVTAFEGGPVPISDTTAEHSPWTVADVDSHLGYMVSVGRCYGWTDCPRTFIAVEPPGDLERCASPGPYACWADTPPRQPLRLRVGSRGPVSLADAWRQCVVYKMHTPLNALGPPVALLVFGYVAAWVIRGFR